MPLTNVWTRNSNGEWTRTTAMQTDKQYSYSVSAYSHHFRCYNCFQYVTFVKGSSNRISHFKHSAGYSDKDCEDRSFNDNAAYTNASVANMEMPMRLTVDNSQITVSIGLLPINYEELKKCVSSNLLITINGTQSASVVYRADWNRISPNMTTWLNVPTPGISKLKVDFSPANAKPKFWSGVVAEIPAIQTQRFLLAMMTMNLVKIHYSRMYRYEEYSIFYLKMTATSMCIRMKSSSIESLFLQAKRPES